MGQNSLKVQIVKDRFGYYYSLIGVVNSARWRPTKKWAIRSGLKAQKRYIRADNAYRNPTIIDGIVNAKV